MSVGWVVILALLANLPIFWLLAFALFEKGEFVESIRYVFTPNLISLFRGEWVEDQWATLKFHLWALLCAAAVGAEWWIAHRHGWV